MEARDVLVWLPKLKLFQNIVPYAPRCARRERGYGLVRKIAPERTELAVFRAEFVTPFGNTVRFIDREERERHALEPRHCVLTCEAFR